MEKQDKLKIYAFSKLSKCKLVEVKRFLSRCEKCDHHAARFYWDSIQDRKNRGVNEVLCYANDKTLVAYMALYHFDENEAEVTLMVDPNYRSPLFYSLLWEQLKQSMARFSIKLSHYVFTCNQQFHSLKDYVRRLGAECSEWTYQLCITPALYVKSKAQANPLVQNVVWREATLSDVSIIAAIETDNFNLKALDYETHVHNTLEHPHKAIWMASINDRVVAKIHVDTEDRKKTVLYDFCIPLEAHDKGYEGILVQSMVGLLFEQSSKKILVDVTDEYDLHWYKRLGFKCVGVYEHWRLRAYVSPIKERVKQLDSMLLNFNCYQMQDQASMILQKH